MANSDRKFKKNRKLPVIAIDPGIFSYGNKAAAAIRRGHKINFRDILAKGLECGICYNGETVGLADLVNSDSQSSVSYKGTFLAGDWNAGVPNTLTIDANTHGLSTESPVIYHVTVLNDQGRNEVVEGTLVGINIDQTNGNVTLSAATGFDGIIKISI